MLGTGPLFARWIDGVEGDQGSRQFDRFEGSVHELIPLGSMLGFKIADGITAGDEKPNKGDCLMIETAGGGGNGPPSKRRHEQVLADVRDGKISSELGVKIFGFDPEPPANSE